jgi:hypothetical protein
MSLLIAVKLFSFDPDLVTATAKVQCKLFPILQKDLTIIVSTPVSPRSVARD